jgi:hypothetical protein
MENSNKEDTNNKVEETKTNNKDNTIVGIIKEIYNKKELEYKDYFLFLI